MHNSDSLFETIGRLHRQGDDCCVVTVVRTANATSAKAGAKAVVTAAGEMIGFVGGGCVSGAVKRVALEVLQSGIPRLIRVRPREEVVEAVDVDGVELHRSGYPSGGTVELFLEPLRQATRVLICGAAPVAGVLADLALAMGYRAILAALPEDQQAMASAATRHEGFDLSELSLRVRDAVVVATQGKRDREALKAALLSPAGYVGIVGSRRKVETLKRQLAGDLSAGHLAKLHGPAGLPIDAIEPEEIALSILAEIVQWRRADQRAAGEDSPLLRASGSEG